MDNFSDYMSKITTLSSTYSETVSPEVATTLAPGLIHQTRLPLIPTQLGKRLCTKAPSNIESSLFKPPQPKKIRKDDDSLLEADGMELQDSELHSFEMEELQLPEVELDLHLIAKKKGLSHFSKNRITAKKLTKPQKRKNQR